MWPLKEKRRNSRRHKSYLRRRKDERRNKDRRKSMDWIKLYTEDDEPEIS